jgi:hypothetical protein
MRLRHRRDFLFLPVIVLLFTSNRLLAQTDPDLLIKPWSTGQMFDTSTDAVLEAANPTSENHHDDVQLSIYHAYGRWRVLPNVDATPRFGYDVTYVDLQTHDSALPRHLWNGTVGFAQPVAEVNKWFVVVTGAAGYAGDTPFSDPHAVFFTGNLIVGRKFSTDKAIVVALNYDGNRTYAPDVPIPAIELADRFNDHLTYLIGFPFNSLIYEPTNGLQIVAGWEPASTFSGRIGWEFLKHYEVYTSYTDRLTAYHLSNLPEDRRLFLQEHRVEAGVRLNPTKLIRLSIGGGWAFGQEFSTGFDERGTNPLRHLRDGPFGRAMIEIGL